MILMFSFIILIGVSLFWLVLLTSLKNDIDLNIRLLLFLIQGWVAYFSIDVKTGPSLNDPRTLTTLLSRFWK